MLAAKDKTISDGVLSQAETCVWGFALENENGIEARWPASSTLVWGWSPLYAGTASGQQDQRYYNQAGAFWSPDPGGIKMADPSEPWSWNRYAYAGGDPINYRDPQGLFRCKDCEEPVNPPGTLCDDNPMDPLCYETGPQQLKGPVRTGAGTKPPPCPPAPSLPGKNAAATIQQNVSTAQQLYDAQLHTNPEAAIPALLGFLTGKFAPGGEWDYKKNYQAGTSDQRNARIFGNFDFGAVLEGLGFSYFFTQNAAGIVQIGICLTGGACGTGTPGVQYPFGDEITDAVDVKSGYDYEKAIQAKCNPLAQ